MDNAGKYYGAVNTAENTGEIIGIPNDFEWGPLVKAGGGSLHISKLVGGTNHGVWEAGIACADSHGVLVAHWNTQVTFSQTSSSQNAHAPDGLSWRAVPTVAAGIGQSTVRPHPLVESPAAGTSAASASDASANNAGCRHRRDSPWRSSWRSPSRYIHRFGNYFSQS